jgi:hypothetical protein
LSEALKADHGFNVESRAIRDLIEVMVSYDATMRRSFLQFITGSPKLPIGGTSPLSTVTWFIAHAGCRFPWAKSGADGRAQAV